MQTRHASTRAYYVMAIDPCRVERTVSAMGAHRVLFALRAQLRLTYAVRPRTGRRDGHGLRQARALLPVHERQARTH